MTQKEEIRLRSYLIWQQEGCPIGNDLEHWLRAKAQIEAKRDAAFQVARFR
ncbi:MAG: DUF2934 domain-containing protein [Rhizomicrobium sp.]|jgi:hypothetical protein